MVNCVSLVHMFLCTYTYREEADLEDREVVFEDNIKVKRSAHVDERRDEDEDFSAEQHKERSLDNGNESSLELYYNFSETHGLSHTS